FWNYQENMHDLMVECEKFGLTTSKIYTLAACQYDLALMISNVRGKAKVDVTQLTGEELEPHIISALAALECVEFKFMTLMKFVGDKYGFEKFRAET
ncbi:hypothetical protein, partial [Vibrio parahaemolyticus]